MAGAALNRRALAARGSMILLLAIAAIAAIMLSLSTPAGAGPEEDKPDEQTLPGDFALIDTSDLDGDEFPDYVSSAPYGPVSNVAGCDPGEVYVTSGADGSVVVTFRGRTCGDQFGHDLAIIRDLNLDGFDDLLIGAPTDDLPPGAGKGHAFAFLGPFSGSEPLEISAEAADFT